MARNGIVWHSLRLNSFHSSLVIDVFQASLGHCRVCQSNKYGKVRKGELQVSQIVVQRGVLQLINKFAIAAMETQ